MFGSPPGKRLRGQRGIARAAGAHDGSAENTQVRARVIARLLLARENVRFYEHMKCPLFS